MRKNQAEEILSKAASAVAEHLSKPRLPPQSPQPSFEAGVRIQETFIRDEGIDDLIGSVRLADWAAAEQAALEIIA
jgi:hypothetical protein